MQVNMPSELLAPGVQYSRHAQLPFQFALGQGFQTVPAALEQELIETATRMPYPGVEFVRKGKHQVEVRHRQELGFLLLTPLLAGMGLALGAVAITAAVIPGPVMLASWTGIMLAAQGRRSASSKVMQHLPLPRSGLDALLGFAVLDNGRQVQGIHAALLNPLSRSSVGLRATSIRAIHCK